MPIGDLLAQISGSKDDAPRQPALPLKRKADDDLKNTAAKTQKMGAANAATSRLNGQQRPSSYSQSTDVAKPPPASTRPQVNTSTASRASAASSSKFPTRPAPPSNGSRPLPSPAVKVNPGNTAPKAPPKKGSYAEIMARAAAAQTTLGTLGKIQHKPLEKVPNKRERQEGKSEQDRIRNKGAPTARPGYKSTAKPGMSSAGALGRNGIRDDRNGNGNLKDQDVKKATNGKVGKPAVNEEKKVRKAALATTGYQGTASARPGGDKKPASSGMAPDTRDRDRRVPFGGRRRNREEEELDDFIDWDDEEEAEQAVARQYRYQSEDDEESDMEAGLSDLDEEERRAERLARLEDQREEAILDRAKREKMEKKKLFAARAAARR